MGSTSSSSSTDVVTAKLILQDGRPQEFPYPVEVSYVLQKNPACFICNSDEMDLDDIVSAMNDAETMSFNRVSFILLCH